MSKPIELDLYNCRTCRHEMAGHNFYGCGQPHCWCRMAPYVVTEARDAGEDISNYVEMAAL